MFEVRKVLEFDPVDLKMLVVQTAACVLVVCDERNPEMEPRDPTDKVGQHLGRFVNWAPHGYLNALQAQVDLLYDFVRMTIDDPSRAFLLETGDMEIITAALEAYQIWKTKYIEAEQKKEERGWSRATAFDKKCWTDLNKKFLRVGGLQPI